MGKTKAISLNVIKFETIVPLALMWSRIERNLRLAGMARAKIFSRPCGVLALWRNILQIHSKKMIRWTSLTLLWQVVLRNWITLD